MKRRRRTREREEEVVEWSGEKRGRGEKEERKEGATE
jgi:hypothetical protein